MKDANPPYNRITECKYVDATTGEILEVILMREFYEWNGKGYVMVRHYQLDREEELNPNRKGL